MDKKKDPTICCLQEIHLSFKILIIKGWKVFHVNGNQKTAGIVILISNKIDFKSKIK